MELELEPLNFPSDQERPCIIAGPCSAETEEQVMTTAKQLAAKGCHMFRAGVWKPRTKPGRFRGKWRGCFTLDEAGKGGDWYVHSY